jgi:hypothetical protein
MGFVTGMILGLFIGVTFGALMMAVAAVCKIDDIRRGGDRVPFRR